MALFLSDIPDYSFSGNLPPLSFSTASDSVEVIFLFENDEIFKEVLIPDAGGVITLYDLDELFEVYLQNQRIGSFAYSIEGVVKSFTVQYCRAELDIPAADYLENFFLTVLQGDKITALDREEYLHLVCLSPISVTVSARYNDGSTVTDTLVTIDTLNAIKTLDVSPSIFVQEEKELLSYTVVAGERSQTFRIDRRRPESTPDLLFVNSFGLAETLYCTGTWSLENEFTRTNAYSKGLFKNFRTEEVRTYKANTGVLTQEMAKWAEELLRSTEIYLMEGVDRWKLITLTDSELKRDNAPDELPSFNFEYRYAQRNHNLLRYPLRGRIFDDTFDRTFDNHYGTKYPY